ncbi:MAG: Na/Pi cotransporter family protein [Schwartzia sp.]|nr:Na/Pi cotransporter family protein [Schwartzia sp. (in: firmicutes)]
MTLYDTLSVIGGLAFFLFGMYVLSSGLKMIAGDRLESALQKMTNHPMKGLAFGAVITIAMQSSSALTVMLVGLVNSGIMSLTQTVGIIMGSNIGTTLTAWILSLSGVKTDNVFLLMMKPEYFSPVLALIGVLLLMGGRSQQRKNLGQALVGFAVLIHGMELMADSLAPLIEMPEFTGILTAFRNPFLGILIGTVFTGVIQSSAASIGVLQALSLTGHISYGVAIPIIMGQNIGTCVTALLSSVGVRKIAKRVSVIHVSFNVIGTMLGLAVYLVCAWGLHLPVLDEMITPFAIAGVHSVFNVATTLVLLPFTRQLVFIAEHFIQEDDAETPFLDKRLLVSPAFAAIECRKKTALVMKKAAEGAGKAMQSLEAYDNAIVEEIRELESSVDAMVESCNQFLIQLSFHDVSKKESISIANMLHVLGEMERISDYSLNLSTATKKINRDGFGQKAEVSQFLAPVNAELEQVLAMTEKAYEENNAAMARELIARAGGLVQHIRALKKAELKSLGEGAGSAESSVYISDYLSVCRRIAEHSQNIAETLI